MSPLHHHHTTTNHPRMMNLRTLLSSRRALLLVISVGSLFLLFYYAQLQNRHSPGHLQYKEEYGYLNGPSIWLGDARVLTRLGSEHMHRWKEVSPYSGLTNTSELYDPSMGQSQVIRGYLGEEHRGGFFVECGALDGETRSNTLYFERVLGWEGLLIEADPDNFKEIKAKGRSRAWASNTCLSTSKFPQVVSFSQNSNQGKISGREAGWVEWGFVDVQCYPLETYMRWLNRTVIDYFSLDVEGLELEILKTIDFGYLDIRTLSVEFIHDKEGKDAIEEFMKGKGYKVLTLVTHPNWLANDFIFVKKKEHYDRVVI